MNIKIVSNLGELPFHSWCTWLNCWFHLTSSLFARMMQRDIRERKTLQPSSWWKMMFANCRPSRVWSLLFTMNQFQFQKHGKKISCSAPRPNPIVHVDSSKFRPIWESWLCMSSQCLEISFSPLISVVERDTRAKLPHECSKMYRSLSTKNQRQFCTYIVFHDAIHESDFCNHVIQVNWRINQIFGIWLDGHKYAQDVGRFLLEA